MVLERLGLLPEFKKAGAVYARTAMFISGAARSPVRKLSSPALCLSRFKMDALLAGIFHQLGGQLQVRFRYSADPCGEGVVSATGRRLQPSENESRWFGVKAHVVSNSAVNLE